jgi:putative membrane protein
MNACTCSCIALALTAACGSRSRSAPAGEDTAGRFDSVAGTAAASMDESAVFGLLDAVNASDSALGALGVARANATEVKDFGRMVTREHHALRKDGLDLARRLGLAPTQPRVPPDAPPEAMLETLASDTTAIWDQRYLDYAIALHRSALENTARALAATQQAEVRSYISGLVPIIQKHIDKAQVLQKQLASRTKTATPTSRPRSR